MIYDSMYDDEIFDRYRGFGHSTWQEGVRLCHEAGVRRLVVFHHDVKRDDASLLALERTVVRACPGAIVARTGTVIDLASEPARKETVSWN